MVTSVRCQLLTCTPTSNKVFGGKWERFDRYEVKDGQIQHVEGSRLSSYEPWDAYRTPNGKEAVQQPYHSLLDLINRVDRGEMDLNDRDLAIAEWCGRHGLLGVLLLTSNPVPGKFFGTTGPTSELGYYMPNLGVWPTRRYSPHLMTNASDHMFFRNCELMVLEGREAVPRALPAPCSKRFWQEYRTP
jgi:hypothetical protein